MATVDKKIAEQIVENDGYYPSKEAEDRDPRCWLVVEYDNAYAGKGYGITYEGEPSTTRERYLEVTAFVRNPKILWENPKRKEEKKKEKEKGEKGEKPTYAVVPEEKRAKDISLINSVPQWPYWPVLPIKRYDMNKRGWPECAVLLSNGATSLVNGKYTIALAGMFVVSDQSERKEYTSLEEFFSDGWMVD